MSLTTAAAKPSSLLGRYSALILLVLGTLWLLQYLSGRVHPQAQEPIRHLAEASHQDPVLLHVLLSMAAILLLTRLFGYVFSHYLGQPPVMGEILAGLTLGPSVLGALAPGALEQVLPTHVAPFLGIISKVGIVLFMFLIGLELDGRLLRRSIRDTLFISNASIAAPFSLGSLLAVFLYTRYGNAGVPFFTFALFIGVSLSITAFPVLARILTDRKMQNSALGATAMASAAIGDVTAWCLLAVIAGVASEGAGNSLWTLGGLLVYGSTVFFVVRPLLGRLAAREEARDADFPLHIFAFVLAAVLISAAITEALGVHALFGAFLVGAVLPHEGRLAIQLRERLEDLCVVLLLPTFFVVSGMRTEIGLISGINDWLVALLVIVVATVGKFGGTVFAARGANLSWRESSALGILMNTRGLMELIVLNLGLDMNVLSPRLFTIMVVMTLVTTFATSPIFDRLIKDLPSARPGSSVPPAPDSPSLT